MGDNGYIGGGRVIRGANDLLEVNAELQLGREDFIHPEDSIANEGGGFCTARPPVYRQETRTFTEGATVAPSGLHGSNLPTKP